MGLSSSPPSSSTKMKLLLALTLLAAAASAQDTHHCPDGWFLYDRHGLIECFYMDNEWASKSTANLISRPMGDGWPNLTILVSTTGSRIFCLIKKKELNKATSGG